MKAAVLVQLILLEDIVQASEADVEADEAQDTLLAINNYMFELAADGVNLGFTELLDLGDEVTVERGAINGMVKTIALQVGIQFGVQPTQQQQLQADRGLTILEKIAVSIPSSPFPDTLPIGTGNECGTNTHFYGETEDAILTESGLIIVPEANTELP